MMEQKLTKEDCLALLAAKQAALTAAGEDRFPRRADFAEWEQMAIKSYFGPWGRALEAAGVKAPREGDRVAENREKRLRARKRRAAERDAVEQATKNTDTDENQSDA